MKRPRRFTQELVAEALWIWVTLIVGISLGTGVTALTHALGAGESQSLTAGFIAMAALFAISEVFYRTGILRQQPVPMLSLASLRLVTYRILGKLWPDPDAPDEFERIVPWPSWRWQRFFLIGSIPLAILIILMATARGDWPILIFSLIFSLVLSGAAVYAGIATRWMRATHEAPLAAKIAGSTSITISGAAFALVVAFAAFIAIIILLIPIFIVASIRAILRTRGIEI